MKTRDDIYREEAATLLRVIASYHAITPDQALKLFPGKENSIRTLIRKLIKQKRLYLDESQNLLCKNAEATTSPDYGMIAAFWVLLDFEKSVVYHSAGDFPTKINFFSHDEVYEIIYVPLEQEALLNHVLSAASKDDASRLLVLENENQATLLTVPNTIAYCIVRDGTVSYYQKGEKTNEQT